MEGAADLSENVMKVCTYPSHVSSSFSIARTDECL